MGIKKKLLFLDIDGVLLNFHQAFTSFLKKYHQIRLPKECLEFHTLCGNDRSKKQQCTLQPDILQKYSIDFMQSKYFTYLESLNDTQSYHQLAQSCRIFLVTNITEELKQQRIKNLNLRNIVYEEIFFAGEEKFNNPNYPSKHQVIQKKITSDDEVIFLDDLPVNCALVKKKIPQVKVFLLDKAYNQGELPQECIRVKNWQEFVNLVL